MQKVTNTTDQPIPMLYINLYSPTCGSKEKHIHKYTEKYNKQGKQKTKKKAK